MTEKQIARGSAWLLFAGAVAFIIATLDLAFEVSSFLAARGFLWRTVASIFTIVVAAFAYLLVFGCGLRRPAPFLRALPALALYVVAMITWRHAPAERFHFVEYGAVYLLALRAATIDFPGWPAYAIAWTATSLAGWFDEIMQGRSAVRYFDWGDVRMNVIAASCATLVCVALFTRDPSVVRRALPPPRGA